MLRYLSGVLMLASASSLVEKLPVRVVFVQFLLSYNIFYYLSFSRSVLGNKVSSESDIERSSLNQRRTGTAHHAILQIRGVQRLIDPCSLPSLAGSLPQVMIKHKQPGGTFVERCKPNRHTVIRCKIWYDSEHALISWLKTIQAAAHRNIVVWFY